MEKIARYEKIARDITISILKGDFVEGDVIKGRSLLASKYNVSPETIRKAIMILDEKGIVEVKHGVGIFVDSISKAKQFADTWTVKKTISNEHKEIETLLEESNNLNKKITTLLHEMVDNFTYKTDESLEFKKIIIPNKCWIEGKSISQVYFYNYTEATIVAVKNNNGLLNVSPGPDYIFKSGDEIIFVAKDEYTFDRVVKLLCEEIDN